MKKCEKCGAELKEEAKFCAFCGAKVIENANEEIKLETVDQTESGTEKKVEMKKEGVKVNSTEKISEIIEKIKMKKSIIFVGVAVLALLVGITMFASSMKRTIKLSDFYEVNYEGGDGFGKASIQIKRDELKKAILKIKDFEIDEIAYWKMEDVIHGNAIQVEVSPNENLKNGDKIKIKFGIADEKAIKGIRLKADSDQVEVRGLEKYKEITNKDLFQDLEISYTNYSPYLNVELENKSNDPFIRSVRYEVDNRVDVENGDEIVITANWDNNIAEHNKYIVNASGEKHIKVEGQAEYILKKETLTPDVIENIKKKVEEDYRGKSLNWGEYSFLNIKELYFIDRSNGRYYVNEICALLEVKGDDGTILYFDGCYRNVSIRDGEIYFGELIGGRYDVSEDRSDYDADIENYKANAKMAYNLLEQQ